MIVRRGSRALHFGDVVIGGGAPIVVQTMTKTDTRDAAATVRQIREVAEAGCPLVRLAVPDMAAARALPEIVKRAGVPLIADIHFDHRLALESLKAGVAGLRLNPGNIREPERVKAVVMAAKERKVPIRIGVNGGSLPPPPASDHPLTVPQRMVAAAMEHVRILESLDFDLIKISLKAFDVLTTVEAYRLMAAQVAYPLHLGITEAGLPPAGLVRSAVGIGALLLEGIGDTIRVSLTAPPREEVQAGYEILKSLDLTDRGHALVSCPTCGRTEADILGLSQAVSEHLTRLGKPLKVAVMGCVVNGPGEARDADVGIACGKGRGVIFRKGEVVGTVEEKDFLSSLVAEINKL